MENRLRAFSFRDVSSVTSELYAPQRERETRKDWGDYSFLVLWLGFLARRT
jgi:hypothetical protein